MNRFGKILGLALLMSTAMSAPSANAEGALSGTLTLTSDYLFRGISQTSGNPALQGSLDYTNGVFYAGVWGSNIDFGLDETLETDVYLGVRPTFGPVTLDFGVIGYFYPGSTDLFGEYDYVEGKVAASFTPVESLTLGGALYYSPEFFGETGEAVYLEANGAYSFSEAFSISAAYGVQDVDLTGDYETWNLGAAYVVDSYKFDLRYYDTDISGLDSEVVLSLTRSF
jgi:uncharacterized protein (TIGR02001 family)